MFTQGVTPYCISLTLPNQMIHSSFMRYIVLFLKLFKISVDTLRKWCTISFLQRQYLSRDEYFIKKLERRGGRRGNEKRFF